MLKEIEQTADVAWRLDAWEYGDVSKVQFVENPEVRRFLGKSRYSLIVAPKGVGKTLLLQYKSKQLRETTVEGRSVFLPKTDLCEKFATWAVAFSKEKVAMLSHRDTWRLLWSASIAISVLYRTATEPFAQSIAKMLGVEGELARNPESRRPLLVKEVLARLLDTRPSEYRMLYSSDLESRLSRLEVNAYVFLDGVDEAFQRHTASENIPVNDERTTASFQEGVFSANIWLNSQLGLLGAIRDLQHRSRNLRIFATLRQEAFEANRGALELQERDLCFQLPNDKEQTREIFEANVAATRPDDLVDQDAKDPFVRFLGMREISWPSGDGSKEHVFDYVYRHTFGRPREALAIGSALLRIPPKKRSESKIRETIRDCGAQLLRWYKQEMIPAWDERYDALLAHISCNVLPEIEVVHLFRQLASSNPDLMDPFSYYINRGMIGWLAYDEEEEEPKIKFQEAGRYISGDVIHEGKSKVYFVHPCLVEHIKGNNFGFFVDPRGVVGSGYRWPFIDERNVLEVMQAPGKRFIVQFNGSFVHEFSDCASGETALFVAVIRAVSAAGTPSVSYEQVCEEIAALVRSESINDVWKGKDVIQKVKSLLGGASLTEEGERTIEFLNKALSAAVSESEERERVKGPEVERYVTWEDGLVFFSLCAPRNIRVRMLSKKNAKR